MTPNLASQAIAALIANIERVIVGKRETVERTVVALISGGHVLIEDVPGVGKTMLARSLALSIGGQFQRIQFTPDLLPTDVTGVSIYDQSTQRFEFRKGPVFANILLADEINRAGPRTQSALLEAMEEHQVTQDGVTYPLPDPFMVIATENPIEYEGVYPLPESQLDRFLLRLELGYPSREEEKTVVKRQLIAHPVESLEPVASADEIARVNEVVRACHVAEEVYNYALDIIQATRESESLRLGASPRGTVGLIRCAQALATLRGRDFVSPDEIKELAPSVLAHRVILRPEARMSGHTAHDLILRILERIRVPA
ncbi:MAG: MoxR family ATPase [Armatimonadetes bacterium]|nr:MoxR family ATPase [Armatimonadota bacterium]